MKIVILGPTHKTFIANFLKEEDREILPEGFDGAPFLGTIINELLQRGHEVISITMTQSINRNYEVEEFSHRNFKWITVPYRKRSMRFNGSKLGRIVDLYAFEIKRLRACALKETPDFIHAHWSYEYTGALKNVDIPHMTTIHDNPYEVFKSMPKLFWLLRLVMSEIMLKRIRFTSTVSPYMLDYAKKRTKEIVVIPNPVRIYLHEDEADELILSKLKGISAPKIIMINNGWDTRKNIAKGLEAFKIIREKYPEANLHLFGYGSEVNGPAYRYSSKQNIKGISYYGAVSNAFLVTELKKMHLMMHPSLEESFGVVLIEAMSFGVPVIGGLDSGAVPWVLKDERLLTNVKNPNSIANNAIELFKNVDCYRSISFSCFQNVSERFSVPKVVDSYESYYETIRNAWTY